MLYQTSNDETRSLAGRRCQTILLLEDEPALLALHREVLEIEGFTVLVAPGLAHALRLGDTHAGPIDLLVADVGAGGVPAAVALRRRRPALRVILTSGCHGVPTHPLGEGVLFVKKPVALDALLAAVDGSLRQDRGEAR
jgi:DNA-binding response OmpR family regulator